MTDSKDKKELKAIKVPPGLHREIEKESTERDLYMYEVVTLAWERYKTSSGMPPVHSEQQSQLSKPHREAHELLQQVLDHGDSKAVEWIIGNLRMFAEALNGRADRKQSRKHG
jgi:hypothetical protein